MAHILLIEPDYKNKYPPLGLMKIAQYHGPHGKGDYVRFIKGENKSVMGQAWDRIYVSSLFSFEFARTARTIDFALKVARGHANRIFVGGIAASLMHERFSSDMRWPGVRFIAGLLDKPPAVSLELDEFEEELYADDTKGTPIEMLVPDYSILDQVDYRYPVTDAYFLYASRGCIRSCNFCGVPKIEGGLREGASITSTVREIARLYGEKPALIMMDNNITASPRLKEIVDEIVGLGFHRGATLTRRGVTVQRTVDFNQGVDARELAKNPQLMKQLARLCVSPLRIAFDNSAFREPYETAVRQAADNGITDLSNYLLFNFNDDPADLFGRMLLNIELNEELGTRIFSFPMRYQPVDLPDRSHVGPNWTRYQLRSLQIMLQATHGIVSGSPDFFRGVFGNSASEFEDFLTMPHSMLFNRAWYQQYGGRSEQEAYRAAMTKLSPTDRRDLLALLSSTLGRMPVDSVQRHFAAQTNPALAAVLPFYQPLDRQSEAAIWAEMQQIRSNRPEISVNESVGDAFLDMDDESSPDGAVAKLVA
ncbi:MAG: radical SAM protein [Desulfovibrio sp.]|uniref:hypothetical protein n=1 Tax=Desulfovibrio sp. TaxID=885 RepID=UPI00135D8970|nr:hypothetical protein [Desulfovibrio sp.]MTJ93580.1 radical SAM protein [Desulfovibrio sp.]